MAPMYATCPVHFTLLDLITVIIFVFGEEYKLYKKFWEELIAYFPLYNTGT
jgi:hypothetical protein